MRNFLLAILFLCPTGLGAAEKPIKIGISMPLSGPLGGGGKASLLAIKLWAEDVNARGGLLHRPVKLIWYDDHTKPIDVQPNYNKLVSEDKVDFILGPYGTVSASQAIPFALQHKMVLAALVAVDANRPFGYPYYFCLPPIGPNPYVNWSEGFFEVASHQEPRPKTVVLLGNNNEYGQNVVRGAVQNAKAFGFALIDSKFYSPDTKDFAPILESIKAESPDIVYIASYPPDSVAIIKAAKRVGLKPKIFGGGMVGLQFTSNQTELGPDLNGILAYTFWTPELNEKFPKVKRFLEKYQAAAAKQEGIDPVGYYLPPYAYAYAQLLEIAINATGSLNQAAVGDYLRTHELDTIVGKINFAPNGETDRSRVLQVQFRGIQGHSVEEFKKPGTMVITYPIEFASQGKLEYPFPGWE